MNDAENDLLFSSVIKINYDKRHIEKIIVGIQ